MIWGYAGVFPGEFGVYDGDVPLNKLRFAARHGFAVAPVGFSETRDPARLATVAAEVRTLGLQTSLGIHPGWLTDEPGGLRAQARDFAAILPRLRDELGILLVTTGVGPFHRFMRDFPLARQLARLREVLPPFAEACAAAGLSLGIENHVDFYIADLAGLCQAVPGLGIFFDTGNCVNLGEIPVEAARIGAPWMVGSHFKDFFIVPNEKELRLELRGCALGEGDVGLEEIHRILQSQAPRPDALVMELELIPGKDGDPLGALERSKQFLHRIDPAGFPAPRTSPS